MDDSPYTVKISSFMTSLALVIGTVAATEYIIEQAEIVSGTEADMTRNWPDSIVDSADRIGAGNPGPLFFLLLIKYGFEEMLGSDED